MRDLTLKLWITLIIPLVGGEDGPSYAPPLPLAAIVAASSWLMPLPS